MLAASLGSEMGASWLEKKNNVYSNKIKIHGRVFIYDLYICFIYDLYTHICVHFIYDYCSDFFKYLGYLLFSNYHSLLILLHIFPNLVI